MKSKLIIASLLLAGACVSVNAQEKTKYYTENAKDNIYLGVGLGGMAVINDGLNTPTFNFNITAGKHISPVWGVRAQIGGLWQVLDVKGGLYTEDTKKTFAELNLDATLNLINLFAGYKADGSYDGVSGVHSTCICLVVQL